MMHVRLIEKGDEAGWTAALAGLPHSIAHTHRFAVGMSDNNVYLLVAEGPNGRAVCPLSERTYLGEPDVFTPYGFGGFTGTGDLTGLRDAWTDFAGSRGYVASYLMQNPILIPEQINAMWAETILSDRTLFAVDLTLPEEERLRLVSSRKRSGLKKWLGAASRETDQTALADAFANLYPSFAQRRHMAGYYQFSKARLSELASLPDTVLAGVRGTDGTISCVALMSRTQDCGDYLFMAASESGEADGAGVLWLGMQALAERGVRQCNLGGGIRENDGVAEMKRRLGGQALAIPVIQEIFDPARYQALCDAAGCTDTESGFFPAYHGRATA